MFEALHDTHNLVHQPFTSDMCALRMKEGKMVLKWNSLHEHLILMELLWGNMLSHTETQRHFASRLS